MYARRVVSVAVFALVGSAGIAAQPPGSGPRLSVNGTAAPRPAQVAAGGRITVTLTGGPGNATDWIALARRGTPDTEVIDRRYLNDATVAPPVGTTGGTVTFVAPVAPGAYEARFFANDSFTRLARSGVIAVADSPSVISVNGVLAPEAVPVVGGTFVTVDVTDGPANPLDWVGLYATTSADPAFLLKRYLNGSATPPVSGQSSATLSFPVPLTAGSYELRFFSADTFGRLATSTTMVVTAPAAQLAVNGVVAPASTTVAAGSEAVVTVAAGPGNAGDAVGLYRVGDPDTAVIDSRYLNDTAIPPATGLTAATLHFAVPTTAGTYEFRFFMEGGYGRLATSGPMVVEPTPARVVVNGVSAPGTVSAAPNSTLTVEVTGGPANPTDWLTLAATGAPESTYLAWQYLNGTMIAPTTGLSSATVAFTTPAAPGTYEVRFFARHTYERLTTSAPIVVSGAPADVTVTLTSPFPNTTFNAPASVALHATAAATGGSIARVEFYDGPTLISTSTSAPYEATWLGPTEGAHVLTAVAVDQTNASTTSNAVLVTIAPPGTTLGTLGAPIATPPGGVYGPGQQVVLTAAPGTTILYTTDGTQPDEGSPVYSAPLAITAATTVQARAYQSNWTESAVTTESYVIDTEPPTILASVYPPPNAAGWNNSAVTVSFECRDQSTVTCPAPINVSTNGSGQIISGTATDAQGYQASASATVNIDTVAPQALLATPASGTTTSDAQVVLMGTAADTGSGLARVLCNGLPANLAGADATCSAPLNPGRNSVTFAAVDVAGNSASAGAVVLRSTPLSALRLSPTTTTMALGEIKGLTVSTDTDLPVTGVTWSSSDSAIVSIDAANDGTIVAESVGEATVTAAVGGVSAEATVRVLAGGVPLGQTIWSTASTPGLSAKVLRANPVRDEDADMLSVESDGNGTVARIKALRGGDGAVLWSEAPPDVTYGHNVIADRFGGVLMVTGIADTNGNVSRLRRVGGGDLPPWEYVSKWAILEAAAGSDGTVYVTESILGEPSAAWDIDHATEIVVLDGRTGAVLHRHTMPSSQQNLQGPVQCFDYPPPDLPYRRRHGGAFGPLTVLEDGHAYVQHQRWNEFWSHNCGPGLGTVTNDYELRLLDVSPTGGMSSRTLAGESFTTADTYRYDGGADPSVRAASYGVTRPDGHDGLLVTWQIGTIYGVPDGRLTRLAANGSSSEYSAPWVSYDGHQTPMMITSEGRAYHQDGTGLFTAYSTENWTPLWTLNGMLPIQGSDDGGLLALGGETSSALNEIDASGNIVTSYATSLTEPVVVLRDQGLLHGIGSSGALAMVAAPSPRASQWTFSSGQADNCTPGRLYRDLPLADSPHIGLVPDAVYSYDLIDTPAAPLGQFQSFQAAGVRDAFTEWNGTSTAEGLTRTFRIRTDEERQQNVQPAIGVRKIQLGPGPNGEPLIGAFPPPANHPGRARITGGTMLLTTDTDYLMQQEGYRLAAMHEIGHALGLAHPTSLRRGGTVMNTFYIPQSPQNVLETRDDRVGKNLARHPTNCDVRAVRASQTP